jgi:putative DNA methylase
MKLIEVALPLETISKAALQEKEPFTKNHPRSMHYWWSRKPLTVCRAALFAQLVDDPSSRPDLFPTETEQDTERARLFQFIERLVRWDTSNDLDLLREASELIGRSTRGNEILVLDPFSGFGSIGLEAQRLGVKVAHGELSPVAAVITKAITELPYRFRETSPIRGDGGTLDAGPLSGLRLDVAAFGRELVERLRNELGSLYAAPDLGSAERLAWTWVRTVICPNPRCRISAPLASTWQLSAKRGQEVVIEPSFDEALGRYRYVHRVGSVRGYPPPTVKRSGAHCLRCGSPIPLAHVRAEGMVDRLGFHMTAAVVSRGRGRAFADVTLEEEEQALSVRAPNVATLELPERALSFRVQAYGMKTYGDLFMSRQLLAMATATELVQGLRKQIVKEAREHGMPLDSPLEKGGTGADAYGSAISVYLALAVSRFADFSNTISTWNNKNLNIRQLFSLQGVPMSWNFVETNPLHGVVDLETALGWVDNALGALRASSRTWAVGLQLDATSEMNALGDVLWDRQVIVCTDPPYYDNMGYSDLADFFYCWLRPALVEVFPTMLSTLNSPKSTELVATPYRFRGGQEEANRFFRKHLGIAFSGLERIQSGDYPLCIYYAFKQAEEKSGPTGPTGRVSTGWEAMLEGVLSSGLAITGTWPLRTERAERSVSLGTNALASSILLVCRRQAANAPQGTRREFVGRLRTELPPAVRKLQTGWIAPVDLAQASIGPGMAVFSKYLRVLEADGTSMSVGTALGLINEVLDEILAEQEGDFDADTRWAVAWFEQNGMKSGPFGLAETLSKAKNTAITSLESSGILEASAGRVRLLERSELYADWDPAEEERLTVWEVTQRLIRALDEGGEVKAAGLLRQVAGLGDIARELAYRLYMVCDRKRWTQEALAYNALVIAWPDISRLATTRSGTLSAAQEELL